MPTLTQPLSFTDAAERILREAKKPLTHKQLAHKAIADKLVQTESETPEISMHVSIRSEMKRRETRGEPQRFVFWAMGSSAWSISLPESRAKRHEPRLNKFGNQEKTLPINFIRN